MLLMPTVTSNEPDAVHFEVPAPSFVMEQSRIPMGGK